ncbi:N-acetylglucosamine-6-phosphate deacetylase [bacterium]|nr:N-acetylglucosamine-6-phosphate deacetylase [bacterium]
MLALADACIYTPEEIIRGNILIADGKVKAVGDIKIPKEAKTVQLNGKLVVPGFIDVHTHGCGGYDCMDGKSSLEEITAILPRFGVTAFFPTGVASPHKELLAFLQDIREAKSKGAKILGAHLESPYISMDKRGAQPPEAIRPVDMGEIEELIEAGVKIFTIAPEVEGAIEAIRRLKQAGVVVSLGHSSAGWEEALMGVNAGISKATHLFNAMPPLLHRQPGCVGVALSDDRVACEVIADFVHLHPLIVKLIVKTKGSDKVLLITDSAPFSGLPDGEYEWLGGRVIVKKEGRIFFKDAPDVLAGSCLTLDQAVRNVHSLGFNLKDVLKMVTLNPARETNHPELGMIRVGNPADLVVLDASLQVEMTLIDGEIVYEKVDH